MKPCYSIGLVRLTTFPGRGSDYVAAALLGEGAGLRRRWAATVHRTAPLGFGLVADVPVRFCRKFLGGYGLALDCRQQLYGWRATIRRPIEFC